MPQTFDELIASRRAWIDTVLKPWCQQATLRDLRRADEEWGDIAGRVDTEATLWTWAWSRFDALVCPDLPGVNETRPIRVTLKDGRTAVGFPEGRLSCRGELYLIAVETDDPLAHDELGPFALDDIVSVEPEPPAE